MGGGNLEQARQTNGPIAGRTVRLLSQRLLAPEGCSIIHQSLVTLRRSQQVNKLCTLHSHVSQHQVQLLLN